MDSISGFPLGKYWIITCGDVIFDKITGRVIDPPLQVWLVIWRAKQQFIELSTKNDPY
jgi:hypothetical protein